MKPRLGCPLGTDDEALCQAVEDNPMLGCQSTSDIEAQHQVVEVKPGWVVHQSPMMKPKLLKTVPALVASQPFSKQLRLAFALAHSAADNFNSTPH